MNTVLAHRPLSESAFWNQYKLVLLYLSAELGYEYGAEESRVLSTLVVAAKPSCASYDRRSYGSQRCLTMMWYCAKRTRHIRHDQKVSLILHDRFGIPISIVKRRLVIFIAEPAV